MLTAIPVIDVPFAIMSRPTLTLVPTKLALRSISAPILATQGQKGTMQTPSPYRGFSQFCILLFFSLSKVESKMEISDAVAKTGRMDIQEKAQYFVDPSQADWSLIWR
jgi:hypothetical protein